MVSSFLNLNLGLFLVGLRPNGRRDLSLKSDYTLKVTDKTTSLETITKSNTPFSDAVNFFVCIYFSTISIHDDQKNKSCYMTQHI